MPLTTESAARKDNTTGRSFVQFEHRHFATLADMIKRMHSVGSEEDRTWIADYFAGELAATNPRFDRARFLSACGVQS